MKVELNSNVTRTKLVAVILENRLHLRDAKDPAMSVTMTQFGLITTPMLFSLESMSNRPGATPVYTGESVTITF